MNTFKRSMPQIATARGVIERLLPRHNQHFRMEVISQTNGHDVFEIDNGCEGEIILRGSNGVSICSALNWYLKYTCECQFDWFNRTITDISSIEPVSSPVHRETPYDFRYYLNYCTFSYTMAFWDWDRWQQEIDWMALNGINFPLAITGQESIWRRVYQAMGLSKKELDGFFAGPAYFGWGWMGNLDAWGGPLPESWFERQEKLQKQILARQRALGMTPILPAFTGHVPAAIAEKWPDASIQRMNPWGGFPGTYVLDPMDPLFQEIGVAFIREQTRAYGTDHFYSADTFNEMDPPSGERKYLRGVSRTIFDSLATEDPEARIVMQGWTFMMHAPFWKKNRIRAFLSGVPDDRLIMLDLFSTAKSQWQRTNAYFGKAWIWCMLHNWGGKMGTYGRTRQITEGLPKLLGDQRAGQLRGIGIVPEGLETNPYIYDLMGEMTWHDDPIDRNAWTQDYVRRRYGDDLPQAQQAWNLLLTSVYSCRTRRHGPQGSHFCIRPTPEFSSGSFVRSEIFYDVRKVRRALGLLLACADELADNERYLYDLVDVARQVISDWSVRTHEQLGQLYEANEREAYLELAKAWLQGIADMDGLVGSRREFLLGRWLESAKAYGTAPEEKVLYEWNARSLITLWGPPESPLHDYAQKQWSGLLKDFYYPRWKILFDGIETAWQANEKPDLEEITTSIIAFEGRWVQRTDPQPTTASGNPVALSRLVFEKYRT